MEGERVWLKSYEESSVRIEVFTERLNLMLKKSDLLVDRLARVFKVSGHFSELVLTSCTRIAKKMQSKCS